MRERERERAHVRVRVRVRVRGDGARGAVAWGQVGVVVGIEVRLGKVAREWRGAMRRTFRQRETLRGRQDASESERERRYQVRARVHACALFGAYATYFARPNASGNVHACARWYSITRRNYLEARDGGHAQRKDNTNGGKLHGEVVLEMRGA